MNQCTSGDMVTNSVSTQGFEDIPESPGIALVIGTGQPLTVNGNQVYLNYVHNGSDRAAAGNGNNTNIVATGYMVVLKIQGNRIVLGYEEATRHVAFRHLNPQYLQSHWNVGDKISPGTVIAPYPGANYGTSGGLHVHVEESDINAQGRRQFMDPDTHAFGDPGQTYSGTTSYTDQQTGQNIVVPGGWGILLPE